MLYLLSNMYNNFLVKLSNIKIVNYEKKQMAALTTQKSKLILNTTITYFYFIIRHLDHP